MSAEKIISIWSLFCRWWCWLFCITLFRMRFLGLENVPSAGSYILVVNHQSYLDPLFAGVALKGQLCFMARDSLFKNWFFGPLLVSVKAIPVRRGQADLKSIRSIIARLNQGEGVCLFAEATRTTDGKIAPFKGGFTLLSRRGDAPVVPVLIDGAFECWPRDKKWFTLGSKITVTYGKPIPVEKIKEMADDDFATMLTKTLRDMQSEVRLKNGKKPYTYNE